VSKNSVKTIFAHFFTVILFIVLLGIIAGLSLKPEKVVVRETRFIRQVTTQYLTDTVYKMKIVPVDKTWALPREQKKVFPTTKYTVYQKTMWMLKAHESFRYKAYPDGQYYSIAFGFNMNPHNYQLLKRLDKLHLIKGKWNTKNAKVTWEDGIELTQIYIHENINQKIKELDKKRKVKFTDDQKVALSCKAYNTGNFNLGKCCAGRGKKGYCQSDNKAVRNAHNMRRRTESLLYSGKFPKEKWETIRTQALKIEIQHK
jgi:GH24 family phage-related lysozyme (muramidase)